MMGGKVGTWGLLWREFQVEEAWLRMPTPITQFFVQAELRARPAGVALGQLAAEQRAAAAEAARDAETAARVDAEQRAAAAEGARDAEAAALLDAEQRAAAAGAAGAARDAEVAARMDLEQRLRAETAKVAARDRQIAELQVRGRGH